MESQLPFLGLTAICALGVAGSERSSVVDDNSFCSLVPKLVANSMTFENNGQTWQVVEDCQNGVIAVLVVDGKRTQRKGYFPAPVTARSDRND